MAPPVKPASERLNPVFLSVDDETLERTDAVARHEGLSRASVIRRALLRDLRRQRKST